MTTGGGGGGVGQRAGMILVTRLRTVTEPGVGGSR